MSHLGRLVLRRQALLLKIQAERSLMAIHCQEFKESIGMVGVATGMLSKAGQIARQRPLLGGLAIAALFILKPRRIFSFARSALLGWETWRSVAGIVQRMRTDVSDTSN
ncbi:YqjK family protein [Undibacterium sp. Di27W]|uniref:YqjK family protein n=1 Tax=Undibacterium sp. Di27W TaxID=3413036 RepID=UPI003BEF9F02